LKEIRKRLTYANVMSSLAVFMVLGGGAAVAANGGLPKGSVGTPQLKKNAVKTPKIAPSAVKTGKLGKQAVKAGKLANGAVLPGKIANGAVLTDKLAGDAVTTEKIGPDAVTTGKLAGGAVTSAKVDGSIQKSSDLLSAIVDNGGALVRGIGAVAASRPDTGDYRVVFNRDVENCVPVATPRLTGTPRYSTVRTDAGGTAANEMRVRVWDPDGNASNFQFNLLVLC
jgi:hypothetical protein